MCEYGPGEGGSLTYIMSSRGGNRSHDPVSEGAREQNSENDGKKKEASKGTEGDDFYDHAKKEISLRLPPSNPV